MTPGEGQRGLPGWAVQVRLAGKQRGVCAGPAPIAAVTPPLSQALGAGEGVRPGRRERRRQRQPGRLVCQLTWPLEPTPSTAQGQRGRFRAR